MNMTTLALGAIVVWLVLMLASLNFGGVAHLLLVVAVVAIVLAVRNRLSRRDRYTQHQEVRNER